MTPEEQSFIELVQWLIQQEDIPLAVRRDLLKHLDQTQQLDKKTDTFISQYLQSRQQQGLNRAEWLRQRGESLHGLKTSANNETNVILQESTELIKSLGQHFCGSFKTRESQLAGQAEKNQDQSDQAQVKALKASI